MLCFTTINELTDDGTLQNDVRQAVKNEFNAQLVGIQSTLKDLRANLEEAFTEAMKTSILNKLPEVSSHYLVLFTDELTQMLGR